MNSLSDDDNRLRDLEEAEMLAKALIQLHKGDDQLVADSLKDFISDDEVQALLGDYRALQARIHARWVQLGFSQPPIVLAETPPDIPKESTPTPEDEVLEISLDEELQSTIEIELDPTDTGEVSPPPLPEIPAIPTMEDEPILIPQHFQIDFPNGKVDTAYRFDLPMEGLKFTPDQIQQVAIQGFEQAGLVLDQNAWQVAGLPEEQGQFELKIQLDYRSLNGHRGQLIMKGLCNINPDPRSLWQEHEPPADSPYPKSHTDSKQLRSPVGSLIGASRRGRSHAHKGTFRDDDFHIGFDTETGWQVLAVADGAGSAPFSREGSRIAVQTIATRLDALLNQEFSDSIAPHLEMSEGGLDSATEQTIRLQIYDSLIGAVFEGYKAILAESEKMEVPPREFATTFLLTIAKRFDQGWFIASYWVGDGCIGIYRKGESVTLLGSPDGGEFAGQTRFFTMSDLWKDSQTILERLHLALVPDFTGLFLMTDGVSDPKFQTDHNLKQAPIWDAFWEDLGKEVDLSGPSSLSHLQTLEWLNFWSQGDHDDRTIAFLLPHREEDQP